MKKVILAIIASVFVLTDVGAVTRIQCHIDTARRVVVIPAVEGGADVAVAVIDRSIGVPDTTVTIASQLLMQSDLHGHVEDAAWYLRAPRREADPAADALMLTQGWTRYDMPAAIRGEINDSLPYPLEIGAQLDGVIRSKWRGKPLAGVVANVLAARIADGASATTDSLGRFHITGLEWPDSTFLVISAMNSKGQLEENIHPEFDSFPAIAILPESQSIAETLASLGEDPADLDNYVARLNSSPQGMQISLKEVVVRATKKREGANAIDYLASVYIRPGQDENIRSYEDAVTHIPGVNVINDGIMYHQAPVMIWVDGRYIGCAPPEMQRISARELQLNVQIRKNRQKSGLPTGMSVMPQTEAPMKSEDYSYDIGLFTNQLNISLLESVYPFLDNESIAYFPPHLSMLFPQGVRSAGTPYIYSAGILHITTKKPGKFKHTLSSEFRAVMPLGYQKPRQFYTPEYKYDSSAELNQSGAIIHWIPAIDLSHPIQLSLPPFINASDISVSIEGLTSNKIIIGM